MYKALFAGAASKLRDAARTKEKATKAFLLAGASALILTTAAASDASANPKNKFSEGGVATVEIAVDAPVNVGDFGDNNDNTVSSEIVSESNNIDIEVLNTKYVDQIVSGNSVSVGANGGIGGDCTNLIGAGCIAAGGGSNVGGGANGGTASANSGNITWGASTFQNYHGLLALNQTTGHHTAGLADVQMATNATLTIN